MKKITLSLLLLFIVQSYSQNQLLSRIDEIDDGGTFVNSTGFNYEYDANGNLTTETIYFWDTNAWVAFGKTFYTYNANNKATEEIFQSFNIVNSMFENSERIIYTYNANGDVENIEDFIWGTGVWEPEARTNLIYTSGLLTIGVTEDFVGGVWVNSFRSTVTYNPNNTIAQIVDEEWNTSSNVWELDEREIFTYDANDNISLVETETRNGSVWEDDYTISYVLDGNGNRISETETYNGGTSETTTYTYDTSALMSSFANPFADYNGLQYLLEDFPYVNKILTITSGSTIRSTFDYNNVLSINDVPNVKQFNVSVFPNPSQNYITVKSSETITNVEIYSALGKEVMSTTLKNINISELSSGIYLMNISLNSGNKVVRKLVKK
ncbi:T9SS type A sorting domain-containing protein [Jejuia pallidilutea]|uniref:Secretion system C-terminal sorting domain-containing protein n=1 Tax=Jejuia pallidilutea TaxID=504487 RepID=A0A090W364_9FLAO|nr:T9SS type A sorting domain-containing protein [Jejuia pallidilutea]GAL67574.1 hypothetical protein JCM19301_861 [Jejuia pallidilutea]GAL71381.1 hypothetical protein JCM19302_1059 [Jejuia pallidilutea]GAL89402.1 hypothetical protein JCM19538_1397 [Jejuia pallidilutea]